MEDAPRVSPRLLFLGENPEPETASSKGPSAFPLTLLRLSPFYANIPIMENNFCQPDDTETIHQVLAGDVKAFERLLEKYQNLVTRIVKKHVPQDQVKDLTQETFIRTYQSLPTFEGGRNFQHWISTIAIRACYDFWRKHGRSREISMDSLDDGHRLWLEAALSDKSSQAFQERGREKEAGEILNWALGKLSAEDRIVLELVYLKGHSVKEAARLLGWSIAKVKVQSFRSRRKLHKLLSRQMEQWRS
jgi:RNA polymerase sigma-70 factor (ECF subfamily)